MVATPPPLQQQSQQPQQQAPPAYQATDPSAAVPLPPVENFSASLTRQLAAFLRSYNRSLSAQTPTTPTVAAQ